MRPWTELTELVAREEARLGIVPSCGPASPSPSARLLAIISSLRAIAEHETRRTQAAELALAKAELERDRLVASAECDHAALHKVTAEKRELMRLLVQLASILEARKRQAARQASRTRRPVAQLVASKAA